MAPKGSRQKRKSVGSSSTLFNAGMMPLLRKAADAVGKNIDVPGKLWGNCPAADKNSCSIALCSSTLPCTSGRRLCRCMFHRRIFA